VDLPVAAGAPCSRVDIIGGAPLAMLEAIAWDAAGTALLATGDGSSGTTLFLCGHPKVQLDLEVRGRPGPFTVLVRPERWRDPQFAAHPIAAGRMLGRAAQGPSMLHEGAPITVKTFALDPTKRVSYGTSIAPNQCFRVAAGTQGDGSGIELRMFDAGTQEELDRSVADRAVSARACAMQQGPRQIRVELRASTGRVDVVVGERSQ
jgi:hypothetical protein